MTRQVAFAAIGSFLVTVTIFSLWSPNKKAEVAEQPPVVQEQHLMPRMKALPPRLERPVLVESQLNRPRPVAAPVVAQPEFKTLPGAYVIEIDGGL